MDDVVNRMARELSDAIAAAVAEDPRIEACRERARAAGFEMKVIPRSGDWIHESHDAGRARQDQSAAPESRPRRRAPQLRDQRER